MAAMTRRGFLQASALALGGALLGEATSSDAASTGSPARRYYACIAPDAAERDPDLLQAVASAGVTDIVAVAFLYGYIVYGHSLDRLKEFQESAHKQGLRVHFIDLPLGHPGDSLGATSGDYPLTPPTRWKMGIRPDGSAFSGTSLHPPAVEENVEALRELRKLAPVSVFLDDDFRLAQSPGTIGGCFCEAHRETFLKKGGYGASQWEQLLDDVRNRRLTPLLRAWIGFNCDQLTDMFRAQQTALGKIPLATMVMYMGAEKAGIRLADYRGSLFRVGEGMFSDGAFGTVEGKTSELFSVLFHRRFARPERAFSETTSFPATALSPANLAAKLCISTIADVRNTMFMSGLTPYPKPHWSTLGLAMKKQAEIHARVKGQTPRGPFKHWWGEPGRYVSDDNPFSLFLASGVPFEVCEKIPADGWAFLSDFDARGLADSGHGGAGSVLCYTPVSGAKIQGGRPLPHTLADIFALKHEIMPRLKDVPYVLEDEPVVCAWYPAIRTALLWNLSEQKKELTLVFGEAKRKCSVAALDLCLVEIASR